MHAAYIVTSCPLATVTFPQKFPPTQQQLLSCNSFELDALELWRVLRENLYIAISIEIARVCVCMYVCENKICEFVCSHMVVLVV